MASFKLRVTPETLEQKADEFSGVVREIKTHFERLESIASKTRGYWQGEAGTRGRESYASYQEDITFIIRRLNEHPADLLEMAGIYRAAEEAAKTVSAQLKTDLIV